MKFSTASCKPQVSSREPPSKKSWVRMSGSNTQRTLAGRVFGFFFLLSMAVTRSRLSCPHTPKFVVHCFQIKSLWVELATDPFQHFFVPSMVGVAYRFHEVGVGPGTATVFGRA